MLRHLYRSPNVNARRQSRPRRLGTIRLRIARTREKSFLPCALEPFQRRAEDVAMPIREAFLRGISTRQVGRVVATLTGEVVSP